jgi:putative protease
MDLVCPAGNLPSLRAAVDNGADAVYIGLRDNTNARAFGGLNFDVAEAHEAVRYAHAHGTRVFLAINTYPQPATWKRWSAAVDTAAALGIDAVIVADQGLMQYARTTHPQLRLHLSVQASATNHEAINFYHEHFGVKRAVLPRVLSIEQVEQVVRNTPVQIEVFGFGSLCVMVEGRCALSSYVTGEAPNLAGVCSPAKAVRWEPHADGLEARLSGMLIDKYAPGEHAAYPTVCKGRFKAGDDVYYAIEEPASLNAMELIPRLAKIGVAAIKIEGRQRSPAYVETVTRVWRQALDAQAGGASGVKRAGAQALLRFTEGHSDTLGAYHRKWK